MNRRKFFQIAGITAGAGALSCVGLTYWAAQEPKADFCELSCLKETNMGDGILVAYASKCGSTGEIAEAVGKVLCESGAAVDVKRVQDVKDLKPYRAVVLGTAIRMSKPLPETVTLAKKHSAALAGLPVACFSVGMAMNTDTPENRQKAKQFLAPLLDAVKSPVAVETFGGKLDYSTLSPLFRWMFSQDKSGEMAEGDWRDWAAIDAWAKSLIPLL
ncbi:MAG: flavodoxin domain-containing protein [Anaerolineales bacterium]|nr:flavodoxin domain-containing protein [Anaerolineales bacterium]